MIVISVLKKSYQLWSRYTTLLAPPYLDVSDGFYPLPPSFYCLSLSFSLSPEVDTKQQHYLLLFRGILFAFPIWSLSEVTNLHTVGETFDLAELESQGSLVLSRVCIFSGNDPTEAK